MDSLSLNMADVNHESHKKILNAGQTREEREQNLVDSIPLFVTKVIRKILNAGHPTTRWTQRLAPSLSDPHVTATYKKQQRAFFFRSTPQQKKTEPRSPPAPRVTQRPIGRPQSPAVLGPTTPLSP
jgi:hypothetical protein